jgi:hypothetical protein
MDCNIRSFRGTDKPRSVRLPDTYCLLYPRNHGLRIEDDLEIDHIKHFCSIGLEEMSDIPHLSNLAISLKNGVAVLKYNRPEVGNALSVPMIEVSIYIIRKADVFLISTYWMSRISCPGLNGHRIKMRSELSYRRG